MTEDELWRKYNQPVARENEQLQENYGAEQIPPVAQENYGAEQIPPVAQENYGAEQIPPMPQENYGAEQIPPVAQENYGAEQIPPMAQGNYGAEQIPPMAQGNYGAKQIPPMAQENYGAEQIPPVAQESTADNTGFLPEQNIYAPEQFCTPEDEAATVDARTLSARGLVVALILLVAGVAIFCAALLLAGAGYGNNSGKNPSGVSIHFQTAAKPEGSENYIDESGRYSTEGIAKFVRPSVVELYAYTAGGVTADASYGSGIILTEDGYIVTNEHIISDSKRLKVVLFDDESRTEYDCVVVGKDKKSDIAVVKIEAKGLPCAVLGDSDETVCGEQVCAVGNPGGLNATVTFGFVSAIHREIRGDITSYPMDCIQTDAAISPGNSGGALVNMFGQVIGITSSKYAAEYYEGLGFAITINEALPIIEEIIDKGFIGGRFRIGIVFREINGEIPDDAKLCPGLLIEEISEECDISNTELAPGDIIVSVEGKDVSSYDTMTEALEGKGGGDRVTAEVVRFNEDGTQKRFEISFLLMEDTSGDY